MSVHLAGNERVLVIPTLPHRAWETDSNSGHLIAEPSMNPPAQDPSRHAELTVPRLTQGCQTELRFLLLPPSLKDQQRKASTELKIDEILKFQTKKLFRENRRNSL